MGRSINRIRNRESEDNSIYAGEKISEFMEHFLPKPETGLTEEQAKSLMELGLSNRVEDPNAKTTGRIIRENTLTFFNLVFLVLAVLLVLAGSYNDMAFLLIAILNALISIVQQIRSRAVLSKLKVLGEAKVKVIRDGSLKKIPADELVREDIVELSSGDQIPADGSLLVGQVQVNEALLTGESDLVTKREGDRLLSGSFIVSGKCRARMEQVGAESYAAQLTRKAREKETEKKTGMMRSLDRLIKVIGFALIPIGIALYYSEHYVHGYAFTEAIPSVVAALVGMIPEGLYLLTSMALAVSVMRLSGQKVLVHDMSAIETLARVDVLCVDKTGTITSTEMSVQEVICLNEREFPRPRVEEILNACYTVLEAENDTGRAMAARFHEPCHWPVEHTIPFTSATKWSAVVFRGRGTYIIGAPEFILGEEYRQLAPLAVTYQEKGCRVLLVAFGHTAPVQGKLPEQIIPVAFVIINNPIRPQAPDTFRYFAEQGVTIKVISGDNPASVSRIALHAGIAGAEEYVDAATLKEEKDYERAAERYQVFGRVTPEQKCQLIKVLQKAGHTVAMTGDGVNDVLALKDADCGIAMASGADAACQAAQMVLLDSDFSKLPDVVKEGRRVINNIQRSAALYLVKNIMSFFLSLITLVAGLPYPFVPIQLTLISALTIGIPSFVLALEPNHDLVKGKFMTNVLRRALPGGLTNIVLLLGLQLFTLAFTFERATLSTLSTVLMGFVGILVLYYIAKPLDWKRWMLLGGMSVSMVVAIFGMGGFFELTPLDFQSGLVISVFLLLAPSVIWFFEMLFEQGGLLIQRWKTYRAKRLQGKKKRKRKKHQRYVKSDGR